METIKYRLTGTCPLLVHNERLANPFDAITREIKKITDKKKKTDEDREAVHRLEWEGGLYYDPSAGPYLPGWNVHKAMVEGARLTKRGKDIERGVAVIETIVPIEYEGPRTPQAMFDAGRFIDIRGVKLSGRKTMRARPKFEEWSCTFTCAIDPATINPGDVLAVLVEAGQKTGIGDFRQRYGRFDAAVVS